MKISNIVAIVFFTIFLAGSAFANPVFTDNDNSFSVDVSDSLDFQLNSTAADNGTISFDKNESIGSLSGSGAFSFTPSAGEVGTYNVEFEVSDDNSTDSHEVTITVNALPPSVAVSVPSSVLVGDNDQDRDETDSVSFSIQNTGTDTLTGITLTFEETTSIYDSDDFDVQISGVSTSLTGGSSDSVTVTAYIPEDFDAGQRKIGNLNFVSNQIETSFELRMEAENKLSIDRVDITVDGEDERVSEDEKVDAKREDEVVLTVRVENTFSSSSDIQMENVEVIVESDDLDIDEESDQEDIDEDDNFEFELTFDIDDDADDGTETVTITVNGEDENGAEHSDTFDFRFDIDVRSREIVIRDVTFTPTRVCEGESNVKLSVDLKNVGTKDLDEAQLLIEGDNIAYTKRISDIEIDEGDSEDISLTIPLPNNLNEGTYFYDLTAFYGSSSSSDTDDTIAFFELEDCGVTQPDDSDDDDSDDGSITVQPYTPTGQAVFGQTVSSKKAEFNFFNSKTYIILLVLANVLLLIIILLLITRASR